MNSYLTSYLAQAHTDDLLRQARKARAAAHPRDGRRQSIASLAHRAVTGVRHLASARQEPGRSTERDVTIRLAAPADDPALARLAHLDSSSVPPPPVLIAEASGEPRAAVSLLSSDAIADPFHPTAALVELLRVRAVQIARRPAARRRKQTSRPRHTVPSSRQEAA